MFSFTYIIGYRHSRDRLQNLKRTLDWINGFAGVEVLLIEQDTHSKISELNLKAKHIFTRSNMPYNRSWAFNVGIKRSNSNVIVFGDSDILMDPNKFIEGLRALDNYEMVSPYKVVVDLDQQESFKSLDDILKINKQSRTGINISGGISMFRKDAIIKIAGFNEDFWSWGGEDDFQTVKVHNFLTWTELDGKCYHLYHEPAKPDMKWYKRNLEILNKTSGMNKDQLQKLINIQQPKIGSKNKCDNF